MKLRYLVAALGGGLLFCGQAHAAAYCVTSPAAAHPDGLSLSDMDLTVASVPSVTYHPIDCYGVVLDNNGSTIDILENLVLDPSGKDVNGDFDPTLDDAEFGWQGAFGTELKDETNGGTADALDFAGLRFTLSAAVDSVSGTWTLTWEDIANIDSSDMDLPTYIDFVAVLKGSNRFAAYLFDDVLLTTDPTSGTGNFTIAFEGPGGPNPALSHMSLYFRADGSDTPADDDDDDDNFAPEPGSLALFGAGLLAAGLAGLRRRRQG